MTEQSIRERIKALELGKGSIQAEIARLTADLNATDGGIQECEYWLSEIVKSQENK